MDVIGFIDLGKMGTREVARAVSKCFAVFGYDLDIKDIGKYPALLITGTFIKRG